MPGIVILAQWIQLHYKYHPEFLKDLQQFICQHNETCELCPLAGCEMCIDNETLADYLNNPVHADVLKYMLKLAEGAAYDR